MAPPGRELRPRSTPGVARSTSRTAGGGRGSSPRFSAITCSPRAERDDARRRRRAARRSPRSVAAQRDQRRGTGEHRARVACLRRRRPVGAGVDGGSHGSPVVKPPCGGASHGIGWRWRSRPARSSARPCRPGRRPSRARRPGRRTPIPGSVSSSSAAARTLRGARRGRAAAGSRGWTAPTPPARSPTAARRRSRRAPRRPPTARGSSSKQKQASRCSR